MRQVYVIEMRKRGTKEWEAWEIHGTGSSWCEGGGLPFYRKRLKECRTQTGWKQFEFRLVKYKPESK